MGQRVNIQYSVDIKELKGEVGRLFMKARERIEQLSLALNTETAVLSVESVELIENLRLEMAQIDYSLSDLNNIITGYLSYKVSPKDDPQQALPPQARQAAALDELHSALLQTKEGAHGGLERALEKFKDVPNNAKNNSIPDRSS